MRRIDIRIQQTYGYRFNPFSGQAGDDCLELCVVQGNNHLSSGIDTFGEFKAQVPLNQIRGFVPVPVVHFGHPHASKLQDVAKSTRRNQGSSCTDALKYGIGGHGGRVQHLTNGPATAITPRKQDRQSLGNRAAVVIYRGGYFSDRNLAVVRDGDDVGKGPANIDADSHRLTHHRC
jgi:hypothetical protein